MTADDTMRYAAQTPYRESRRDVLLGLLALSPEHYGQALTEFAVNEKTFEVRWDHLLHSALLASSGCKDTLVFKEVLSAQVVCFNEFGTALWHTIDCNFLEGIELLIKHGAKPDSPGNNWIIRAAKAGNLPLLKILLKANPDLDQLYYQDRTALMYAARYGHSDCVEALIEAGANVAVADSWKQTALDLAIAGGHMNCSQPLWKAYWSLAEKQLDRRIQEVTKHVVSISQ